MAIDIPLELDSGPITWVKAEIDNALFRVLDSIDQLRSSTTPSLRDSVRRDLHQVSGAFELVGIEGLAVLTQEFERHFTPEIDVVPLEALELVDRGCRRLLSHLKEMASGAPPVPLRFISEYLSLGKLRRSKFGPADLFFPDLSRRPAKVLNASPPDPSRMPAFLLRQRRDFQRGLLQWLRGNDAGLDQMRFAIKEIESAYPLPSQRSFWWATLALLEAAHSGLLESSTALKQLMARVDLQVRRFVEGSTRVADRLRREVLYHVARAQTGHPHVDAVKALYDLGVLVPKRIPRETDVVALQPAVNTLQSVLGRCKDAWTSLSSGRSNALIRLQECAADLPAACDALQMPDFSNLGRSIASAATSVVDAKSVTDDLSIEFATSLILLETALEHIAALPTTFRTQVDRAVQRLAYAVSNSPIPDELRAELEANSLTRLAQEKQTIAQVAREIRSNMRSVEQALDAVFRDPSAIDELTPVPALLGQVSGAMRMLGWNDANELLTHTSDRLIALTRRDGSPSASEIDSLADILAGLSFYVDVRERRDQDAGSILASLTRRLRGEIEPTATEGDDSVEASIAERQRMLRPLARAMTDQPERPELREQVRSTLQGVRQDAELLSNSSLSDASNEALRLLDGPVIRVDEFSAAVAAVVGGSIRLPPTSTTTSRLVASRQEVQDTALLEIFVEEAVDVIASVRLRHGELVANHDQREILVDVRRAFHTLKGSGRMVGLTDLAEVAWRVEGVLNQALESERAVTEQELKLMAGACEQFAKWLAMLQTTRHVRLDVNALDGLVESCAPPASEFSSKALVGAAPGTFPKAQHSAAPVTLISQLAAPATVDAAELDELLANAIASLAADDARVDATTDATINTVGLAFVPSEASAAPAKPAVRSSALEPLADDFSLLFEPPSDEIHVLGVAVSRALFSILTDETRVHLQTLDYELTLMQFDSGLAPSDAMVRASHTLCGIHRTAGFLEIGDFAGLLESGLLAVRRSMRTPSDIGVFAAAIQSLRTATLRLQAQSPMSQEEHGQIERSHAQLRAMILRTGNTERDVEVELLEQMHAEAHELELSVALPISPLAVSVTPLAARVESPPPHANMTIEPADAVVGTVIESASLSRIEELPVLVPFPARDKIATTNAEDSDLPTADKPHELEAIGEHPSVSSVKPELPLDPAPEMPRVRETATAFGAAITIPAVPPSIPPSVATTTFFATTLGASAPSTGRAASSIPYEQPIRAADAATTVRSTARSVEDPLTDVRDDIDDQVLPIFIEEAQELFPKATEHVSAWRNDARNPMHSDGLKRTLHTLKGSARMAGAMRLGEIAHNLETHLLDASSAPTSATFDSFDEYLDDIAFLLERLTVGEKDAVLPRFTAAADVSAAVPDIEHHYEAVTLPVTAMHGSAVQPAAEISPPRSLAEIGRSLAVRPTVAAPPAATEAAGTAYLRVRSDSVEQLADEAGEISIHRSRIEAEMRSLKAGLLDLTASVVRLRGQLREIEIQGESQIQSRLDQESKFDPLEFDRYTRFQELTRGLAEGVNDVATVQQSLLKNLADADIALLTQTRLSRSVQLRLQTLRTVPFSNVSDRLYRVLRQTAKELGKRANLDIQGGRIEIDRSVLERLAPVLEHLVRNALAHGVESEQSRLRLGKPGIGEITLSARQQGNEVAISVADDGNGIPLDKVRNRAVALGLISAADATTDAQLVEFIFRPGFSTAEQITAVAGRGVGMDVVRSEVASLGGRVEVRTENGVSTSFTLSVPLTLAVTQVLLVGVGKSIYGIPSSLIAQVRQLPTKARLAALASGQLDHEGHALPLRSLGELLRVNHDIDAQRAAPVVVLRAGGATAAFQVDRIIGNQEVVSKPYGPQLARVPGLAGLTVLANGTIALLLNPLNLLLGRDLEASRGVTAVVTTASAVSAVKQHVEPTLPRPEPKSASEHDAPSTVQTAPPLPAVRSPARAVDLTIVASASNALSTEPSATNGATNREPADEPPPMGVLLATTVSRVPVVLVVDDSLTVRKITTRLLEREGYKALTAKDGLDALQILSDINPDVILLDIEMPRMDGFEFTKTLKADDRQRHIPIIMITSRTAEKHRNHAMELGVNEYVGKPYQDENLLALIFKYAGRPT